MYYILTHKSVSNGVTTQGEAFLVDDGRIIERGPADGIKTNGLEVLDLRSLIVLPGFIDIHVHGGHGHDTMDGTYEALNEMSLYKINEGCTSFCPATVTSSDEKTEKAIKNLRAAMNKGVGGAKIIGAFLEGPVINPKNKGAHPEEYIKPVNTDEIKALVESGEGCVVSFAIAPELPGAAEAIEMLKNMGINIRIGHSSATAAQAYAAVESGANIAIHTYNAMSPLAHREPAMVGAILTNPGLYGEIICDLVHVHPLAVKILVQAKGPDKTIIITDCMSAGGLPDGKYMLGELDVNVVDSVARTLDGALAGSTTTMIAGVKNMVKAVGVPLEDAVQMATSAPAKAIGIYDRVGSLDMGKSADIIAVDDDFNVKFVMVDGVIKKDFR